ncbi:MAG: hypothetical protein ACE5GC_01385 [Acidimicrobiia bacterium]
MRRWSLRASLLALLPLVLIACSDDDATEDTSTSTTAAPITTIGTVVTTTTTVPIVQTATTPTTATTTTLPPLGEFDFPEYTIVSRREGEAGDTVVVVIDPDFASLSDIDLQNVLADVVERFPPVSEAHVVDSTLAADLVLSGELDEEARTLLEQHYLVRLEEGFRIVFVGPFEEAGTLILGS